MQKRLDWKQFGQFLSILLNVFTVIRDTFKQMGVGLEIIPWLVGGGREVFIRGFLEPLGEEFLAATSSSLKVQKIIEGIQLTPLLHKASLCLEFRRKKIRTNQAAADLLELLDPVALMQQIVDLVVVTVADLGLKTGATREQIYKRALERGYKLCSGKFAPFLRMQYEQPCGERLYIAMEPWCIAGINRIFCVAHGSEGYVFEALFSDPPYGWDSDTKWVFALLK